MTVDIEVTFKKVLVSLSRPGWTPSMLVHAYEGMHRLMDSTDDPHLTARIDLAAQAIFTDIRASYAALVEDPRIDSAYVRARKMAQRVLRQAIIQDAKEILDDLRTTFERCGDDWLLARTPVSHKVRKPVPNVYPFVKPLLATHTNPPSESTERVKGLLEDLVRDAKSCALPGYRHALTYVSRSLGIEDLMPASPTADFAASYEFLKGFLESR